MRKVGLLLVVLALASWVVACELPPPPDAQKGDTVAEPGGEPAGEAGEEEAGEEEAGEEGKPCPFAQGEKRKPCDGHGKGMGKHDGKGPHGDGAGAQGDCDCDCGGHGHGGHGMGDCDCGGRGPMGHGMGPGRGMGWQRGAADAEARRPMPLIGDPAPAFVAKTTQGEINFPSDYAGKWIVFFSHPGDFTPVCTTEFMTFAAMEPELAALNTQLVGLSIDSTYSHIAWLRTIKEKVEYKGMKDIEITFPLIEDLSMEVAKTYGMLQPGASTTQAVRAVFIIDPEGTVRAMLYYPPSNGRNIDEIKRLLIALQRSTEQAIATPANWQPGEDVIIPPPGSCGSAKERVEKQAADGYACKDWFLCFKPDPGAGDAVKTPVAPTPEPEPAPAPAPADPATP